MDEEKVGHKLAMRLCDLCELGIMNMPLELLMKLIGYKDGPKEYQTFAPNTAFAQHAKRTFALVEVSYPFKISIEK